ncbi:neural-cadherin [Penaeus vannamei]|uniref:neural-cadherin n=1 Tax=Penaeus vannamei TaxID=6689 RepID=UPI00387F7E87
MGVRLQDGRFMDPVKLQGLLSLHLQHLESVMNVRVTVEDAVSIEDQTEGSVAAPTDTTDTQEPSSVASLASTALPLQVVDTNSTSLVTPRLTRAHDCRLHARDGDAACTERSCLNGGRCVRMDKGNRCVCPGGASGPRCKVAARSFRGSGWAWVPPLPPCLPSTLSLRLLTRRPRALVLYSGPLSATSARPRFPPTPMMALQLVDGRPQLLMEGARGRVRLQVNASVSTGTWHTLHVHLNGQGVTLMVDLCGRGWADATTDAHCAARATWRDAHANEAWSSNAPLQLGGLAHPLPEPAFFGWNFGPIHEGLEGCISHLTVNGQLVDLGEPAYSSGSSKGCEPQDAACRTRMADCGFRGRCVGGLNKPECSCDPGWAGRTCATPTEPIALAHDSFVKVALSFTPDPYVITAQLRVRTRGRPDGVLLQVLAHHRAAAVTLRLRAGVACAWASGAASGAASGEAAAALEACVEGFPLGDGTWHTVRLERHGHNLLVAVDDGDGWRRNESLASFLTSAHAGDMRPLLEGTPMPIMVDKQDCCVVGGQPEFEGEVLVAVNDDLRESCVDDLRVSGHAIPLSVLQNDTRWGQVINQQQVEKGCPSPDLCTNATCAPPLSCHNTWAHAACSCGAGRHLVGRVCRDVDECQFDPCLHGGTCYNSDPGYQCACAPSFAGENCQWAKLPPHAHSITPPMIIAAIALSSILMVVLLVLVTLRMRRCSGGRGVTLRCEGVEGLTSPTGTPVSLQGDVEYLQTTPSHDEHVFLEAIKIKIPGSRLLRLVGKAPPVSHTCTTTLAVDEPLVKEVSVIIPSTSKGSPDKDSEREKAPSISRRCSVSSVIGDVSVAKRLSLPRVIGSPVSAGECPQVTLAPRVSSAQPLLPQDDLRAYAYEGDGSPSGSLTSTVLGLRAESLEDENVRPLLPEYGEVFDLLRNLPDAVVSSSHTKDQAGKTSRDEGAKPGTTPTSSAHRQTPSPQAPGVKVSPGALKAATTGKESVQDEAEAEVLPRTQSLTTSSLKRSSTSGQGRAAKTQTLRKRSLEYSSQC